MTPFGILDQRHYEWHPDTFTQMDAAIRELRRLTALPWDQEPNRAPCTSWRTCGREWVLAEFGESPKDWRELEHIWVEVAAAGVTRAEELEGR